MHRGIDGDKVDAGPEGGLFGGQAQAASQKRHPSNLLYIS
jgi:hypothetical protein